jgi:hypothetical protein
MLLCVFALAMVAPCRGQAPAQPAEPAGGPRIVCAEPTYNFGEMDESNTVEHGYIISNAGDATLNITNVRAGCGCTVASLRDTAVSPGSQTVVTVRFSLRGRRGSQNKSVTVRSNDPLTPSLPLWFSGTSTVEIGVSPALVDFGSILPDKAATQEVHLISRWPGVVITNLSCDSTQFAVRPFDSTNRLGKGFWVSVVPPLIAGQSRATIRVSTDHPRQPEFTVPIVAFITPEARVMPQQIIVQRSVPSAPMQTIVIFPGTVAEYRVLKVEPPLPDVEFTLRETARGTFRIDVQRLVPSADLDGKAFRIFTDLPTLKEITVPVRVLP